MTDGRTSRPLRWLSSRKHMGGMAGGMLGGSLAFFGLWYWPIAAVAGYGLGYLVTPADPPEPSPALTDPLRDELSGLVAQTKARSTELPDGTPAAVTRIAAVLRRLLDRLDGVGLQTDERFAAPQRLVTVTRMIRTDLPGALDGDPAELPKRLDAVACEADALAAEMLDRDVPRAGELTAELLRRHGAAGPEDGGLG